MNVLKSEGIVGMSAGGQRQAGSAVIHGVGKKYRRAVTLNQKQLNWYVMSLLPG